MSDAKRVPGAIEIGSQIGGRYLVEALLGRGGMGAVYRVMDRVLGERVALKALVFTDAEELEIERFLREVRLARRITHKNVARTFDVGSDGSLHYLTMELVQGPSLRQLLRAKQKLSIDVALAIASQVAEGLAAAHAAGIVHRDLKPSNVLVSENSRAVIVDFGVARALSEDQTLTQGVIGTPAYMAPEQLRGEPSSERTDLYALGLLLHEMVAGALPHWGRQPGDWLARLSEATVAPPEIRESSPELADLIETLLALEPSRRLSPAREVARVLRGIAGDSTELCAAPETVILPGIEPPPTRAPSATQPAPFAPLPDHTRGLAVLPFKERNVKPGLGTDLADELIDALTRARGLRVLASRATARFSADTAPEAVGAALSVDFIVEGTVQQRGDGLRVTARLIEVTGGVQIWSDRFEGSIENVIQIDEQIAQRIAEALRLEFEILTDRGTARGPTIELYMTGRKKLRELDLTGDDGAVALLERAVELAPGFRPALAAAALAFVKRAFAGTKSDQEDLVAETRQWVERALAEAADLPETQLAASVFAAQGGDYATAAVHLRSALTIAPTYAEAQEYLGHLQCEAGRASEGVPRLMQALALDPLLRIAPADLARHHLLHGRQEEFQKYRNEVGRRSGGRGAVLALLDLRAAAWSRNSDELRRVRDSIPELSGHSTVSLIHYADFVLEPDVDEPKMRILEAGRSHMSARFSTLMHQLAAEGFGLRGRPKACLEQVEKATERALADLEWLEYCPAIECVRKLPEFADIVQRVTLRTQAIWSV